MIPENEDDALSNDIATGFEVQPPGHAIEQPAIDSDVEEELVIDQPLRDPTPNIDVEEKHEDNRPIAQCCSRHDVKLLDLDYVICHMVSRLTNLVIYRSQGLIWHTEKWH